MALFIFKEPIGYLVDALGMDALPNRSMNFQYIRIFASASHGTMYVHAYPMDPSVSRQLVHGHPIEQSAINSPNAPINI